MRQWSRISFTWLERTSRSKWALALLSLNAFSEALFFFILPDFLLLWLCVLSGSVRRNRQLLLYCFGSSLFGAMIMVYLCMHYRMGIGNIIFELPFTSRSLLQKVDTEHIIPLLSQAFSGIPFKVWAYQALVVQDLDPLPFLSLIYLGRGMRMFAIYLLGTHIGLHEGCRVLLKDYWLLLIGVSFISLMLFLNSANPDRMSLY